MADHGETGNPVELDELEIVIVVDNETDTLSSIDAGVPQIPEVAHLLAQTPTAREFEGHECKPVFDHLCWACHGFSALITGRKAGASHSVLFDVGPDGDLWLDNAKRLGIDLSRIECVFLSHWHFDHSGGLPKVVAAIAEARRKAGFEPPTVDLHPRRPDRRGLMLPNGVIATVPDEPGFEEIAAAGGDIARRDDPHALCEAFFFASGEIERVTDYETGLIGHYSFYGAHGEDDPLILDERFVAAQVRDRGVTVLSACSHAGIINACLAARQRFAGAPVDAVLGGFHLAGKGMEARIDDTVRDLEIRIGPALVAPGHCTGWRAKAELARTFAPGRYAPSVVGTRYRLRAHNA